MNSKSSVVFLCLFFLTIFVSGFVGYHIEYFSDQSLFVVLSILGAIGIYGWWYISYKFEQMEKTYQNLDRLTKETLHELNIPIATIVANVEMIEHGADVKTLKRLERITKSTHTLKELYRQLDHTIKQEIFTPEVTCVNLKEVIEERLQLLNDRKGEIRIESQLVPLIIHINVVALGRIIDNLLINAIKYNQPQGSINILITKNELIIRDTGCGISPQNMLHIFDQYYKVDEKTEGYGLGLSIVKHYCDFYKIGLKIDSIEDEGTSVHLNFKKIAKNISKPLDKCI